MAKGESAATIAIEGMSSSKPEPGPGIFRTDFGFGLFITRRLIEENHGRLTILSGHDEVTIERYIKTKHRLKNPWNWEGFIGLVLDLAYPLPLEHVYEEAHSKIGPAESIVISAPTPAPATPEARSKSAEKKPEPMVAPAPEKLQEKTPLAVAEPSEHSLTSAITARSFLHASSVRRSGLPLGKSVGRRSPRQRAP